MHTLFPQVLASKMGHAVYEGHYSCSLLVQWTWLVQVHMACHRPYTSCSSSCTWSNINLPPVENSSNSCQSAGVVTVVLKKFLIGHNNSSCCCVALLRWQRCNCSAAATMCSLPNGYRTRDFHPLDYAHVGRTKWLVKGLALITSHNIICIFFKIYSL